MKKAPAPSFESSPASGNTASDPTDRVAVTAREVTYEDPKILLLRYLELPLR